MSCFICLEEYIDILNMINILVILIDCIYRIYSNSGLKGVLF